MGQQDAKTPVVSVLMPVYNGERWLSAALESALAQTFEDLEVVVVDDGSTDGSASIVESFAHRDARVRLVRAEHGGLASARSISLAEARAPLVAFLDADDEWLPRRLELQLPHVDERTVVFSDAYVAESDRRTDTRLSEWARVPELDYPATGLFPHLVAGNFIPVLTVLAPRELLLEAGGFRGFRSTSSCDFEMWSRLALRGARFHYVGEPLAVYRKHDDAMTADWLTVADDHLRAFDGLMPEARGPDRRLLRGARRRWRKMLEVAHRKQGWREIAAGEPVAARQELMRSLLIRPYSPRAWLALPLGLSPRIARRIVRRRV